MTEEEIKAAEEAKALEDAKNAEDKKLEDAKKDEVIKNLVEEVKDLRLKNGTYKDLWEGAQKATDPADPVSQKVEEILRQKEAARAKANKEAALAKFIADNKEFDEGNDPAGIKRQALINKFEAFNTSGLTESDQFYLVIKDAQRLLGGTDKPTVTSKENPYSSSGPGGSEIPKFKAEDSELSPKEKALMTKFGYSKEKIQNLKAKNPDFLESILDHVRD